MINRLNIYTRTISFKFYYSNIQSATNILLKDQQSVSLEGVLFVFKDNIKKLKLSRAKNNLIKCSSELDPKYEVKTPSLIFGNRENLKTSLYSITINYLQ